MARGMPPRWFDVFGGTRAAERLKRLGFG